MFQTLTGIHEPSTIQQLPDGRFLVVEDEKAHSFGLVTLRSDDGGTEGRPGRGAPGTGRGCRYLKASRPMAGSTLRRSKSVPTSSGC